MRARPGCKVGETNATHVESHVRDDDRFDEIRPAADIGNRPQERGGAHAPNGRQVATFESSSPHCNSRARRHSNAQGNSHLDRIAWLDIQAMEPCGCQT